MIFLCNCPIAAWQLSADYSQLSNYKHAQRLNKNKAVNAPIKSEEIVMVMISNLFQIWGFF